ncbi:TetR/AcrR family transcriptional regulator [Salinirubellus sp. GCM10025818]|uniref:TetR/AcrR family transcriptional regulator n=1 Tax=Salinirubellus TaxID=2162630 RepID=UPI0030D00631
MTDGAAGTRAAIMEATFAALSKHGYADLTIQTIADEFEKSKSLLYYHYETKDDLLGDFLEFILDAFEAEVDADEGAGPEDRLWTVVELLLPPDIAEDEEAREFRTAIFELRMQAPYDERYAERFAATDERMIAAVETILADGVEEGVFDVDPEADAELLLDTVMGVTLRTVTAGTDDRNPLAPVEALVERFRA